jgi:hypothetical protein
MEASNFSVPVVGPFRDWIDVCGRALQRAIDEGDVSADLNVEAAAHFISPAFTGVQTVSQVLTGRTDLFQRVQEMWELLLPGLLPAGLTDARRASLMALPAQVRERCAAAAAGPASAGSAAVGSAPSV